MSIPKTIHYCWFGGKPKSALIQRCIKSWQRCCPDYEIIEWNESNFDINCCPYVKEAYDQKKWAYVSDYARFYLLYTYGGIYVDTDVEMRRNITPLVEKGAFAGFANDSIVATGLILCCEQGNPFCKAILQTYEGEHFIDDDPDKILAVGRRVSAVLQQHGLVPNGEQQDVFGLTVYPKYYFNPTDGDMHAKVDERAYSVHHYAASWFSPRKRFFNTLRRWIGKEKMQVYYQLKERLKK